MLHKTKGIVINYISYKETSIIAKIYTQAFGLQTYIENGVRTAKGKHKISLFQALTLLDLVVYHDSKKEIHRISELRCSSIFNSIPVNIQKSAIAIFINEVLQKTLKETGENDSLFLFLENSILLLDGMPEHFEDFHLHFMIQLSYYLGFGSTSFDDFYFQMAENGINLDFNTKSQLSDLYASAYGIRVLKNKIERNAILDILLKYYSFFIEGFKEFKTLDILRTISI